MTRWKRTVPALLVLLIASSPVVYYQAGNLVYTQAAANSPDCSGHSARNSPDEFSVCLLYTSPSPRDGLLSRMPSSA